MPSKIKKKTRNKIRFKGCSIESVDKLIPQPLDKGYYMSLIGIGNTKGKALKSLMNEKKRERE